MTWELKIGDRQQINESFPSEDAAFERAIECAILHLEAQALMKDGVVIYDKAELEKEVAKRRAPRSEH